MTGGLKRGRPSDGEDEELLLQHTAAQPPPVLRAGSVPSPALPAPADQPHPSGAVSCAVLCCAVLCCAVLCCAGEVRCACSAVLLLVDEYACQYQ